MIGANAAAIMLLLMVSGAYPTEEAANWTVYLRRAGQLRIGMSLSEARRALGDPQASLAWADAELDDSECGYLESDAVPKSVGVMFQRGRLVRIDISEPGIRTASGAGVGDTEERIRDLYPGQIRVEPHHYAAETGNYLNYVAVDETDRGYGMVFETENGRVTSFRTGLLAAIALVEGCS